MYPERLPATKWDNRLHLLACYNCGDRIDGLIMMNRKAMAELFRSSRQWAEAQLFSKVG